VVSSAFPYLVSCIADTRELRYRKHAWKACLPRGGALWISKDLEGRHDLYHWPRPTPVHTVAWSRTASRRRNTRPAKFGVLNVVAWFRILTSRRELREYSLSSDLFCHPQAPPASRSEPSLRACRLSVHAFSLIGLHEWLRPLASRDGRAHLRTHDPRSHRPDAVADVSHKRENPFTPGTSSPFLTE